MLDHFYTVCIMYFFNSQLKEFNNLISFLQDTENETNLPLHQVSVDEILEMQREEQIEKQQEEEKKKKALLERGLAPHPDPIQDDFF